MYVEVCKPCTQEPRKVMNVQCYRVEREIVDKRLGVTTLCGAGDIITAHTVCDTAAAALSLYGVRGEYGMTSPARPATETTVLATPNQRSRPATVVYNSPTTMLLLLIN